MTSEEAPDLVVRSFVPILTKQDATGSPVAWMGLVFYYLKSRSDTREVARAVLPELKW